MASCDTFVALPSVSKGGCVVFGKNSDRPSWEVQEVVYCPPVDYQPNATVQVGFLWCFLLTMNLPCRLFE